MRDRLEHSCQQVIALLTRHTGRPPHPEPAVTRHLQGCPSCAQWKRTLSLALTVFGTAADVEVPPALQHRLEEDIL
jgi:hypothetical protein